MMKLLRTCFIKIKARFALFSRFQRYLLVFFVALVLAFLVILVWPEKDETDLLTAKVQRQDIEQAVHASGTLKAYRQVDVGAQVTGKITRLLISEGQKVKQGELLIEIDPKIAHNNLQIAQADLAREQAELAIKEAQLAQYRLDLNRQQAMIQSKATSQMKLEEAQTQVTKSKAEVAAAKARVMSAGIKVTTAHTELTHYRITAPMDGTVLSIAVKTGQTLVSNQQVTTLLQLAELDTMTVKAKISEVDVVRIRAGQAVYFTLIGDPNTRYQAQLRTVELAPTHTHDGKVGDNKAIYYYAQFDVPNPTGKLRVAMTTQLSIVLDQRKQVLSIPLMAIYKKLDETHAEVQVLKNKKRVTQVVILGLHDDVKTEVIKGLNEGDEVILNHTAVEKNDTVIML